MVRIVLEGGMGKPSRGPILGSISILVFSAPLIGQIETLHPECTYFGANRSRYVDAALRGKPQLSSLTEQVTSMRQAAARDAGPAISGQTYAAGSIDTYI